MRHPPAPKRGVLPPVMLDRRAATSLGAQIAQALREAIRSGHMQDGARLPPSRNAAEQLGVGRNAVVDAYDELLAEGLVETRGRLGSFVSSGTRTPHHPSPTSAPTREADALSKPGQDWRLGQTSIQLLPLHIWRTACREAGRHLPPSDYGDPRGVLGLREAIAEWLLRERGIAYDTRQIVLTQGAGAAIDALAKILIKPGDICAVESPGYTMATLAMERAGAKLVKVPVDSRGIDVDLAFQHPPKLIHLTPGHQYPMGGRLSSQRRQDLVRLILRHGGYLIENEYDHEFIFDGHNHAPVAASLPENTILVSTFAKAISPSLRVGFIAAPRVIADTLTQDINQSQQHVSWPVQVSLQWLLRSGEMRRHLRRVHRHFTDLRQQLLHAIARDCPGLQILSHEGGPHVVLTAGQAQPDDLLAQCIRQRGVILQTLRDFGGEQPTPLMGYGHMGKADLASAATLLAAAWADAQRLSASRSSPQAQPGTELSAHISGSHSRAGPASTS